MGSKSPRRIWSIRQAAVLCVLLTIAPAVGCITHPNGRPVGADTVASFASVLGVGSCDCCQPAACGAECSGSCGEYVDDAYPIDDEPWIEPWTDEGGTGECETGAPCCHGGVGSAAACDTMHAATRVPCDTFAETANFCIAPAAIGPRDVPPPGRFMPVPTQPVFAPRYLEPIPLPLEMGGRF